MRSSSSPSHLAMGHHVRQLWHLVFEEGLDLGQITDAGHTKKLCPPR